MDFIQLSWDLLNQSRDRIIWNLFLAFIPLAISYYLFRPLATRNLLWWMLLIVFGAFLPNAPYILTDSIHILELSRGNYPLTAIILVLIPQYALFIVLGFEAYAIALTRLDNYLITTPIQKHLNLVNGTIHSLCAVGIYLGRFERFNSWDLVTRPIAVMLQTIQDLSNLPNLLALGIALSLIWSLTELTKLVNTTWTTALVQHHGN